ncbi:MAG TPA: tetratricopeptide repeat protein [Terriglobales bacterium]|nr:tetratricopeptide repeat protein [Terriglobales bacterium]
MRQYTKWMTILLVAASVSALQGQNGSSDETAAPPAAAPAPSPATAQHSKPHLPIKAKTHEEYVAYQAAITNKQDPEAMAKAAADFAAKFPDSDCRVLLYRASMKGYRTAAEPEKMMDAALKVLELDNDDPEALLSVAEVQEEHTTAMDLDRNQRMEQALANAQHALKTMDTDLIVPVGTPADRVDVYKKYLKASALGIIGTVQYKEEKYPEAEASLRQAIDADPTNIDSVLVLRLALALDQQKKYEDALAQVNRAIELSKDGTEVARVAKNERDRLSALVAQGSAAGGADVAPPANDNSPGPQGN